MIVLVQPTTTPAVSSAYQYLDHQSVTTLCSLGPFKLESYSNNLQFPIKK